MSRERLTESLMSKSDARARAIWQEAELQAQRYRQEADERCADQRREAKGQQELQVGQQLIQLSIRVEKRTRRIRLLAEEQLLDRLRLLATDQLGRLTTEQRTGSLRRLAAELPELDWQQVTVHPDDRQQAVDLFPDCAIDTDPALLGGVVAATTDKAVCVDNSLSRRLDQIWPKLSGSVLDSLHADKESKDAKTTG